MELEAFFFYAAIGVTTCYISLIIAAEVLNLLDS
jgi:hypothetical protein